MNKRIILALVALSWSKIFCISLPAGQSSPTPDVNAMVNVTSTSLANVIAPSVPTIPPNPTDTSAPATGGISGHLSYPSDFIPPLQVVAFDAANASVYYYVDTPQNQSSYTITGLPAGKYHVVSYWTDSPSFAGGYTKMVPSGLAYGCNDHSFIDVTVTAGLTTTGIDPGAWYADAGTFPPMPTP